MKFTGKLIRQIHILLLIVLSSLNLVAQTRWYKVTSPDKEFTVEFPSEPEYVFRPNPDTGYGTGVFRIINGNYAFEASYQEVVLPLKTDDDVIGFLNMTKDWQRQSWEKINVERTRIADLSGGGYESDGYGHFNDGRPKHLRTRTYFRGRRLYIITCTSWSPSGLGGKTVSRYLDSFRFLNVRLKENRR
jgi:hypothetical protein